MKYHIFLERLFETSHPSKGLLSPFNIDALEDVDTSDGYFENTLYKKAIPAFSQKPLNNINIIDRAIVRLTMPGIRPDLTGFGGFGFDGKGDFYCDYYDGTVSAFNDALLKGETDFSKERHIIMKIDSLGVKLSGSVIDEYGGEAPYLIKTRNQDSNNRHSSSAAIYAIAAYIIAKHERGENCNVSDVMYSHYKDISDGYSSADMATFMKGIRALDADLYTLFQYGSEVMSEIGDLPFNTLAITNPDLDMVSINDIGELITITGDSKILKGDKEKARPVGIKVKRRPKTIKEYVDDGAMNMGAILNDEEKELIPKGFDDFTPSEITLDVAREVKASSLDPIPARNFMFTGETGTGKTTESQMLAVLLGLPYRSMNLSSDKLSSDILVSCLPNNEKVSADDLLGIISSFPDSETIAVNPDAAYFKITGIKRADVTEEDINVAKAEVISKFMAKAADFKYVDSPFVESFRFGGVIELQEVNSCKAAILKSLNEALDDLNIIHLPTGEVIHRHPNCVVVVTANIGQGYEGINNLSNDFIARFHQADVFELPDDLTLIKRIKDRSGFEDEKVIRKMIKVMHAIQRVLLETKGDYGSCSPRGLIAWARKTKNCGDAYLAGCKTIVGLATQEPEIRVELLHALETEFAPNI